MTSTVGCAIDPVPMMVSLDENSILVPLVGREFPERKFAHNPGLPLGVDDHPLAGVGEDAAAALLVEHAVVVGSGGDDIALVAGDDRLAQVGALGSPVLQAAVARGADLDLHPKLEVLDGAAAPGDEAIVLERAVRRAGQAAVLDLPVLGATLPALEVLAVEDRREALGRLRSGGVVSQDSGSSGPSRKPTNPRVKRTSGISSCAPHETRNEPYRGTTASGATASAHKVFGDLDFLMRRRTFKRGGVRRSLPRGQNAQGW